MTLDELPAWVANDWSDGSTMVTSRVVALKYGALYGAHEPPWRPATESEIADAEQALSDAEEPVAPINAPLMREAMAKRGTDTWRPRNCR
jgi:hypothetical protein